MRYNGACDFGLLNALRDVPQTPLRQVTADLTAACTAPARADETNQRRRRPSGALKKGEHMKVRTEPAVSTMTCWSWEAGSVERHCSWLTEGISGPF